MQTGVIAVMGATGNTGKKNRGSRACPNKTSSTSQSAVTLYRVAAFCFAPLRLFEIARVLVRLGHVASFIVNTNHGII
jgi:hypothetical protein